MNFKLNAVNEAILNIGVCETIVFHPTLNVILASFKDNFVYVIHPESGLVLHTSHLSATKDDSDNKVQWKYVPGLDKILVSDGYRFGCRSSHNGVLLLDTILQKVANTNKDVVNFEMLSTDALSFLNAIQACNLVGFDDLKRQLTEKIDISKNIKNAKAQKWATVCLTCPLEMLAKCSLTLLITLIPRKPSNAALPLLSAILEQISEMSEDQDTMKLSQLSRMGVEARRRATFEKWPHKNFKWAFPEQMAKAGFFHEPDKNGDDRALCFTCSICLISWELMDEPWTEHERHSPTCPFIQGDFTTNVPVAITNATAIAFDIEKYSTKKGFFSKMGTSSFPDLIPLIDQQRKEILIFDISSGIRLFHAFRVDCVLNFGKVSVCTKFDVSSVCLVQKSESESKQTACYAVFVSVVFSNNKHVHIFVYNFRKSYQLPVVIEGGKSPNDLKLLQKLTVLNEAEEQMFGGEFDIFAIMPLDGNDKILSIMNFLNSNNEYGGMLIVYEIVRNEDDITLLDHPRRRFLLTYEMPLSAFLIPNLYQDDASRKSSLYTSVCVDGAVRIYDLDTFALLIELSIEKTKFISATFCQSLERLCCATDSGLLQFYKLVNSNDKCCNSFLDSIEKEETQFLEELKALNSNSKLDMNQLRQLYSLCEHEPVKNLDLDRKAFVATVSDSWNEVVQPTLQHKQHPILEIMSSIMWKYVDDFRSDSNFSGKNNEHIFELNLLSPTYLSHIDVRLVFNNFVFALVDSKIEISLLSSKKRCPASVSNQNEMTDYNIECGPINVEDYIDNQTYAANITLTCPNLFKSRSRTLFVFIKLTTNTKATSEEKQEEFLNLINKTSFGTTSSDVGDALKPSDDKVTIQGNNSIKKSDLVTVNANHLRFPIENVTVILQSPKQNRQSDFDVLVRNFLLESNTFLEVLIQNMMTKDQSITERVSLTSFDILLWIIGIRLVKRCGDESSDSGDQTVLNDQKTCFQTIATHIPDILRHCFFHGDRSIAHKCAKFIHRLHISVEQFGYLTETDFVSETCKTLTNMLMGIDEIESSGALHWFIVTLLKFASQSDDGSLTNLCLELLKKFASQLESKTNEYHCLLRSQFDLFGDPFEPELYDVKPQTFNLKFQTNQPQSYAAAVKDSDSNQVKIVPDHNGDSLSLSKQLLFEKNLEKIPSLLKDWFPEKFLYGLLEVEPLHFTCIACSEGTSVLRIADEKDLDKLIKSAKVASSQKSSETFSDLVNSVPPEIQENLKKFISKTGGWGSPGLNDSLNKLEEAYKNKNKFGKVLIINQSNDVPNTFDDTQHQSSSTSLLNSPSNLNNVISKFFTVPPKQVVFIERFHSGARRFVTLDFGCPVMLTDILIPSCGDLASLAIDVCLKGDFLNSRRIIVSTDIFSKYLIINDLQPIPICRYVKITLIGRYGMSSSKCKTLIGSFYGHVLMNDEKNTQINEIHLNQLKIFFEDVNCKYRLACSKLKNLLQPILNQDFVMEIDDQFQSILTNTPTNSKSKSEKFLKITSCYDEAMLYKYQLNILRNIFARYPPIDSKIIHYCNETANSSSDICSEKLVMLSESIFDLLWNLKDLSDIEISEETCRQLFYGFCLNENLQMQMLVINFLVNFCSKQVYWGTFISKLLMDLYSANKRNKTYSDDRVFILLCYMGSRSLCRSSLFDALLMQMTDLILPLTKQHSQYCPLSTQIDIVQLEWFLLYLSIQFDFVYSCDNWKWINNNKLTKYEPDDTTSSDTIVAPDASANIAGHSANMSMNHKPKKKSKVQKLYPTTVPENKTNLIPKFFFISHSVTDEIKNAFTDFKKDSKNCYMDDEVFDLFKDPSIGKNGIIKALGQYKYDRLHSRNENIKLHKLNVNIAMKALVTLLVKIDVSCHVDLIPIICKVIAQLAKCSQSYVNQFISKNEFKALFEIYLSSSNSNNDWIRYSMMNLILDLLETTFDDLLSFRKIPTDDAPIKVFKPPSVVEPLLLNPSYYSTQNISSTIDDRIGVGSEISTEHFLRKITARKAGSLIDSFNKVNRNSIKNSNLSKESYLKNWPKRFQDIWTETPTITRFSIVSETVDEIIENLFMKSLNYFDNLIYIWTIICLNFQVNKLENRSYKAITKYFVDNASRIHIRTWNHAFMIFYNLNNSDHWCLIEDPNFFQMLQKLLSKHDLNMKRIVSVPFRENFDLFLNSIKNQFDSRKMKLFSRSFLQNNWLKLLNYLVEPDDGPFARHLGPLNLQIEFLRFMALNFDLTIDDCTNLANKQLVFDIIRNSSQLMLNQMNLKNPVYCLSLGAMTEDQNKNGLTIDLSDSSTIPCCMKSLLYLLIIVINNMLMKSVNKKDMFPFVDVNQPSSSVSISYLLDELLDDETIVYNFVTILSQSDMVSLKYFDPSAGISTGNPASNNARRKQHMCTIEDAIFKFLVFLLAYNTKPIKVINPILKLLKSTVNISEVFVMFLYSILRNEDLISMFLENGGSDIVSNGIVNSIQSMTKKQCGTVSSMMRHLINANKDDETLQYVTECLRKRALQEAYDIKRGLMNFAPLSTIFCPLSSPSYQPDNLIHNSVPPHRRSRSAQWNYTFPPNQSFVDIYIILPYAVQVNEVQIQPFLNNLSTCPSAVALEISKYATDEYVPITKPLQTEGMTFIRLFLPIPEVVTKLVLRFYKPTDSNQLGLAHIRILGTTAFQNFSTKQAIAAENFGWIRLFWNIITVPHANIDTKYQLPIDFQIDQVLEAYCHLLLSPINILSSDLTKIEDTLLHICLHDEDNGLKLLNLFLSGQNAKMSIDLNESNSSFMIPVMFNSMSKYSICKILYDMCNYYEHRNAMFLNRVNLLLNWIESLTTYVIANNCPNMDNCSIYVHCISRILWPPHNQSDNEMKLLVQSGNLLSLLCKWSLKLTETQNNLEQAINSVLCSICAIESNQFYELLNHLNCLTSASEHQSSSSSAQSFLAIDQKVCLTRSQIQMLTMVMQSQSTLNIFLDSGLLTILMNTISGFCMKSSTLPMSNTQSVTNILKLLANLCYWKEMQNWLGSKGSIFWKLLLEKLCCRDNSYKSLDSESYAKLEDECINFVSKCCLLHHQNQKLLAKILCDIILLSTHQNHTNMTGTNSNLSSFMRRIILQILLESEKVTVFVKSDEMVFKNDVYPNISAPCHPEFKKTLCSESLQLSVNCTLKQLLTSYLSFGFYLKPNLCLDNQNEQSSSSPSSSTKKKTGKKYLWNNGQSLNKLGGFLKKQKNVDLDDSDVEVSVTNSFIDFSADVDVDPFVALQADQDAEPEADVEQNEYKVNESSDDGYDAEDDDDIKIIWSTIKQKSQSDNTISSPILFDEVDDQQQKNNAYIVPFQKLFSNNEDFVVTCSQLPNVEQLPLDFTLGQVYKLIELSGAKQPNLCIRLNVTRNIKKEVEQRSSTGIGSPNVNDIRMTTTLQEFSAIGGLALLSQHLTIVSKKEFSRQSSNELLIPQSTKSNENLGTYEQYLLGSGGTFGNVIDKMSKKYPDKNMMDIDGKMFVDNDPNYSIHFIDGNDSMVDEFGSFISSNNSGVVKNVGAEGIPINSGSLFDVKPPSQEAPFKESTQSLFEIPNYSLTMFNLCLRLPGYADNLLNDMTKACYLLRIVLGVSDNEDGVEIVDLPIADSLPLLPFEVLRRILDETKLDQDTSVALRNNCVSLGIINRLIKCLSFFLNQKPHMCQNENNGLKPPKTPTVINLINGNGSNEKTNYWAKGTGFGTGSTQQTWNVDMALVKQRNEEKQVSVLLNVFSSYINPGNEAPETGDFVFHNDLPESFIKMFSDSSIISTLTSYLRNDSVLDMSRHVVLYAAIFKILRAMSMNADLVKLICSADSNSQTSIISFLEKMYSCLSKYEAKLYPKKDVSANKAKLTMTLSAWLSEKQSGCDENVSSLIPMLSDTIRMITYAVNLYHGNPIPMETNLITDNSTLNLKLASDLTPEELYVKVMEQLQFGSYEMIVSSEDTLNNFVFTVSYHYESLIRTAGNQTRPTRVKRLAQEAVTLSNSLPLSYSSTVFVRTDADRLDVMKVLITGPADTPYSNGCFEFDVYFPLDYPKIPMLINLETTGFHTVRFNPNLYNDGKVCLSVLNTWHGRPEEKWNHKTSSFLQVLVSIQSLILVSDPYFNEPGYERSRGTPHGNQCSKEYNMNITQATIRWGMLEHLVNPSPCFKEIIETHFYLKRDKVFKQLDDWIQDLEAFYNEKQKNLSENAASSNSRSNGKRITMTQIDQCKLICQEVKEAINKLNNPLSSMGIQGTSVKHDEMIDLSSVEEDPEKDDVQDSSENEHQNLDQDQKQSNDDGIEDKEDAPLLPDDHMDVDTELELQSN